MRATRNSKRSRSSSPKGPSAFAPAAVFALLLAFGALVAWWFFGQGYTLYWGDAEAHLNVARRMIDSRTPGYEQIGTVWLPLPHLLMLPFVGNDYLWRTGLAGTIPSVFCFALAGAGLFATVRLLFGKAAAFCATALFALNPNVLYLAAIPMTEAVLLATVFWLLYFVARYESERSLWSASAAGLCAMLACLTRYEGWVLLPFLGLYFLLRGGVKAATAFSVIAATAPLYWFGHNHWYNGNALEFYNGPYSPMAIQAGRPYPGKHDWLLAAKYYYAAVDLCAGTALLWLGLAGLIAALWKRAWLTVGLLAVIPVYYVINVYAGASPIFVPTLWPNSYYNTRYGIGTLPLLIIGAAGIVAALPERFHKLAAWVVLIVASIPWIAYPHRNNWVNYKESEVNSLPRRTWTRQASAFLRANYRAGDGILISAGDLFGVIRESGLTLKDTLHIGNGPHLAGALARPDLFLWERWALAISADPVASAMMKDMKTAARWKLVRTLHEKDGPVIEIYRRTDDYPIHQSARSAQ